MSAELRVVEEGERTAPSILLIHGTAGSLAWWDAMIPALAEHRHVVRVDLAGHGQSPLVRSYGVPTQAGGLGAVVDALGIEAVTVVGHSSGGLVATALPEERPDLVSAVVLVDTGPTPDALLPQGLLGRLVSAPVLGRLIWALRSDASIGKDPRRTSELLLDFALSSR
jgi:pimeloyl-ACP methyl ester carboxylesterase